MSLIDVNVESIFTAWLERFTPAFQDHNARDVAALFVEDGYWKDMLAFSWSYPTFQGRSTIEQALATGFAAFRPHSVRPAKTGTGPRLVKRSGRKLIEAFFEFDTIFGAGKAFVRLLHDPEFPDDPKIWVLLTTLQQLNGYEERIGAHRPSGEEFSKNQTRFNWLDIRKASLNYDDRDPEVIIIGAGHSGLALAARLRAMGVDALIVEKSPRVGDVWRNRYHSLTLHNQIFANHLPYMPFPETWPVWLPKDKLANWLENYADSLELNVWTSREVTTARYDDAEARWSVVIRGEGGAERILRCRHVVAAMGISGSIPNIPELPGLDHFKGVVQHSSQFKSGADYTGKTAIVVGTGNSGHDVAQDLYHNGVHVILLQRGPSCVVSLEPTATKIYSVYAQGLPVEDVDLQTAAVPFPVLEDIYKRLTVKARVFDEDLLNDLKQAGFQTYYGSDDTGFHMMYLRGEGGYYIDVGCSKLISSGAIKVIDSRAIEGFDATGIRMADGAQTPVDLVVLATGFKNMKENVARILGADTATKIGKIWGFNEEHMMRNVWSQTPQKGFWVMGGGLIDARLFSRFLAIQIAASLKGELPQLLTRPAEQQQAA